MKITIYIGIRQYDWQTSPCYCVTESDMSEFYTREGEAFYQLLDVREIEVPEMPSKVEMNGAIIKILESRRDHIKTKSAKQVSEINKHIADLLCLEHLEANHE